MQPCSVHTELASFEMGDLIMPKVAAASASFSPCLDLIAVCWVAGQSGECQGVAQALCCGVPEFALLSVRGALSRFRFNQHCTFIMKGLDEDSITLLFLLHENAKGLLLQAFFFFYFFFLLVSYSGLRRLQMSSCNDNGNWVHARCNRLCVEVALFSG
jgi:hypothetical protein